MLKGGFPITDDRKLNRRFAALQGSFFGAYSGTSFFSYILLEKGVSNTYIGLFGALTSLSSSLIQPVWGILCDRYRCHRVFYLISSLVIPLLYLVILRVFSLPALAVCALISGMFINCIQNMGNGWVSALNGEGCRINYGLSRSFGSLAFAVMSVVLGWAIQVWGYPGLICGMALCGTCCILSSFTIPRARERAPRESAAAPRLSQGLRIITGDREYLLVVVAAFFSMAGVAGINSYFSAYLAMLGASAASVGVGNFAYAIAEAPFMFLYQRLSARFSFRWLFLFSLFTHGLQCVCVGISPNYVWATLAMLLQGPSFGLLVPCLQHYTASRFAPEYTSTAQLFTSAVSLSASMIFGSLLASFLSRYFTLPVTFLLCSLFSFFGFLLYGVGAALVRPPRTDSQRGRI